MQITKFGHSCLLVEENGAKILIDPGSYSVLPQDLSDLDAVLITHEHQDHCDEEKIKKLREQNSGGRFITNTQVAEKLKGLGITAEIVEQGSSTKIRSVEIKAFGNGHAVIHPSFSITQNTGYLIAGRLFHPGDALDVPPVPVEILALPIVAPWSKISETLDYLKAIKPKRCLAIHDGFIKEPGAFYMFTKMWCEKIGTEFIDLEIGKPFTL